MATEEVIRIGILALQGAVEEHAAMVRSLSAAPSGGATGVRFETVLIHDSKDMTGNALDGIILPGGESTTMAIVGERCGVFSLLKEWVRQERPVWGTCAGMILLSDHAVKTCEGGQSLIGGLDVSVCRNFFGSQVYSAQIDISLPLQPHSYSSSSSKNMNVIDEDNYKTLISPSPVYPGVFIRAPAILRAGHGVDVLAKVVARPHAQAYAEVSAALRPAAGGACGAVTVIDGSGVQSVYNTADSSKDMFEVIIAAKHNNCLVTAFHPELTKDDRWHRYFANIVRFHKSQESLVAALQNTTMLEMAK